MAMTKGERERMERLERAVKLSRAMSWPSYPLPSPMTGYEIDAEKVDGAVRYGSPERIARGWFANSYDGGTVTHGCSNGTNHSSRSADSTNTQGTGRMYRTEADAWMVVRIEMTEKFSAILADVDARIAGVI